MMPRSTPANDTRPRFVVAVTAVQWLSEGTFEIRLERPDGFDFIPGQKISFVDGALRRDYTLLGPVDARELALCVRLVPDGLFSPRLSRARIGDRFQITAPFGYFTLKTSGRPAVFVATGTGIAPFVAFANAGARGFDLLHGVRIPAELYYRDLLFTAARRYIPCISAAAGDGQLGSEGFAGRVNRFLEANYPDGAYDFFLCGRNEMIRDVTRVIDARFSGSRVFIEAYD